MGYVADLHTHSPYAIGTSRQLKFENLATWAKIKGIELLSTGDFTHPMRLEETRRKLRDDGDGLFSFDGVRFILGTEVSCVARQDGRGRRVHLLLYAPSIDSVEAINGNLSRWGKLGSDGRPTLRMLPRDLASLVLETDSRCLIVPAHLWTPWYGAYGSKSGFDSLEECFGDMADHIHGVETGLSSDPSMNWKVPSLDGVSIVSFSDAHSLPNLGRELTVFGGELSYDGLSQALRDQQIEYTVEFFPEEGKYHHSGHRKCGVSLTPAQVKSIGPRCPECGGLLTLGVLQRVEELSGREIETRRDAEGYVRSDNGRPPFKNLVSLRQVVSESLGFGPGTKKVHEQCLSLVDRFGSELSVLTEAAIDEISASSDERTAEGIARVRAGEVVISPGYDGVYGTVKVWGE